MPSNRLRHPIFLLAGVVSMLTTCISISPSEVADELGEETGSTNYFTSCLADDYECYGDHLRLLDENFDSIELTAIGAELPEADGEFAPEITASTAEISASLEEPLQLVELDWDDPTLMTPAFCLNLCPRNVLCASTIRCTRAKNDGIDTGTWRAYIYYTAFPDGVTDTTQELDLTITPMASLTGEDPVTILEEGSFAEAFTDVAVGLPVTIPQEISGPLEDEGDATTDGDNSDATERVPYSL